MDFASLEQTKKILDSVKKDNYRVYCYNSVLNNSLKMVNHLFEKMGQTIFLVMPNTYKATCAYEAIVDTYGLDKVNLYLMDDFTTQEVLATSTEYEEERIFTLSNIIKGVPKIIVTNATSVARPIQNFEVFKDAYISIRKGESLDLASFIVKLNHLGYKRASKVENIREYSVRGEVLDIFPPTLDNPVRLDISYDEVENIKEFSVESQRSIRQIEAVDITIAQEILLDKEKLLEKLKRKSINSQNYQDDIFNIENDNFNLRLLKYLNLFEEKPSSILDYVSKKIVCVVDAKEILEQELFTNESAVSCIDEEIRKAFNLSLYFDYSYILSKYNSIYFSEFKNYISLPLTELVDAKSVEVASYYGNLKQFFGDISAKEIVKIYLKNAELRDLVLTFIEANNVTRKNIEVLEGKELSVRYIEDKLLIASEDTIFKKLDDKSKKYRSKGVMQLTSTDEIGEGDYVVHYNYGIAKYLGIKTVELKGVKNDYIYLQFDGSTLYLPVENIGILDKYEASEGHVPHLSKLGSKKWEKKKKEIKERLAVLAKELINTEAARKETLGEKYSEDKEEQEMFEDEFEYELTLDQKEALDVIKREMEEGKIIDRLICGDVGYGKTEVAMRIAFKTVMEGKQVAYLAPTTILSRQHYYLFKDRMEKFGINVAIINRFVSKKEIENIKLDLARGVIDVVIGTHALLNESIKYKDLGLLIIDEEQRFGVEHKERIKKLKTNINVLTLSATPIPRTLQMALVGVRSLSLITTPPKNRFPVKTYVLEENDIVIKEAIYEELGRKGQVFYLHNRVDDLDELQNKLQSLVPEARIAIGHGKMDKDKLEDIIQSFIDKEIDVLLCTTIIETGIDIPNSNTLIVDMADRLGLAQMYQLRGRVGRSSRLGYAYFTYPKKGTLSDDSIKRLNAIKEFTSLGSGYKIALRDLSIRGAGDILGKDQSGFINDLGLDLYVKLLDEEVKRLSGVEEVQKTNPAWKIEVSKYVDDAYVKDDDIKIYIHKRINEVGYNLSKDELTQELIDRFGTLSQDMKIYIEKKYFDYLVSQMDVEKVGDFLTYIQLTLSEEKSQSVDPSELFSIAYKLSSEFNFEYRDKKIIIKYNKKKTTLDWLKVVNEFLEKAKNI